MVLYKMGVGMFFYSFIEWQFRVKKTQTRKIVFIKEKLSV